MNSRHPNAGRSYLLSTLYSGLLACGLLGFLSGELHFWHLSGEVILSGFSWKLCLLIASSLWLFISLLPKYIPYLFGVDRLTGEPQQKPFELFIVPWVFIAGFAALLLSDFVHRDFGFYPGAHIRADIFYLGLFGLALWVMLSRKGSINWRTLGPWGLIACQVFISGLFLYEARGRMIFSDDHTSFMYRLQLLIEHFPKIPFYNTDWNAGYVTTEFYPTGVLNIFLLVYPFLIALGSLATIEHSGYYTLIIPYLFVFVIPWSVYLAARILNFGRAASSVSGILALGPSLEFFQWLLKYGTLGFSCSVGLYPLVFALVLRVFDRDEEPRWWHFALLFVSASLCLLWTLSGVIFIPAIVYAALRAKRLLTPSVRWKALIFVLFFIGANVPWILSFFQQPKVQLMIKSKTLIGSHAEHFHQIDENDRDAEVESVLSRFEHLENFVRTRQSLKQGLAKINPLLVFLFIPGILLLRSRDSRLLATSFVLWLVFLALVADVWKPQLEFRRMSVVLSFFMALFSGLALDEFCRNFRDLLRPASRSHLIAKTAALVGILLIVGATIATPLLTTRIYINRSAEKYSFVRNSAFELSRAINEFGGNGRTAFLEFVNQEWGSSKFVHQNGGHLAPLPRFSGKEIYAIDYYQGGWGTVEVIPAEFFSRGDAGIEEFLDVINATAVVTLSPKWAERCMRQPGYELVYEECRPNFAKLGAFIRPCFRVFQRPAPKNGYFLSGSGGISHGPSWIDVAPATLETVIKYRYHERLSTRPTEGVELFSVPAFWEDKGAGRKEEVFYIGLRLTPSALAAKPIIRISVPD